MQPPVSAVVPIYNVSAYLRQCLDSLLGQTLPGVEILCVDDGSTDGSGDIADTYAAEHPNVRVLHVPNGGLGRARNIGAEQAAGKYLMFVDSDDIVPAEAYERMFRTAEETGSDFVTGHVMRYDGTSAWLSGLHSMAILATVLRTHIRDMPSLVYDTAAWNKMFRRTFWDEHSLSFPEGIFWEDIPVMIPAHVLARQVDVLHEPVYWWRERQDGSLSISQRRTEPKNLEDRMQVLHSVNDFLIKRGESELKKRQDRKALTLDIQLYLRVLLDVDDHYRERFMTLVGDYLATTHESVLRSLSPLNHVKYHLVRDGDLDALLEVLEYEQDGNPSLPVRKRGTKLVADVPFTPKHPLPPEVLNVSRSMPIRAGVDDVAWRGEKLVVDGYAYIDQVGLPTPVSGVRRLQLRETTGKRVHRVWPIPTHRRDVTAGVLAMDHSYSWSGFRAALDVGDLAPAPGQEETVWELVVQLATPWAARGTRLGPPMQGRSAHPRHRVHPDGLTVVPGYVENRWLSLTVRRDALVVDRIGITADHLQLEGRLLPGHGDLGGANVVVHDRGGVGRISSPVEVGSAAPGGATRFTASLELEPLVGRHRAVTSVTWDVSIEGTGLKRGGSPVTLHHDQPEVAAFRSGREVVARPSRDGRLELVDRTPVAVAQSAVFGDDRVLRVRGRLTGSPVSAALEVRNAQLGRHRFPATVQGDRFACDLSLYDVDDFAGRHPLGPGTWELWNVLEWADGTTSEAVVTTEAASVPAVEQAQREDSTRMRLKVTTGADVTIVVLAQPDTERGGWNQKRLRKLEYRVDRRVRRVRDLALFESWRGKQYSDSPRAISEELTRRGGPEQVWVVENDTVPVPAGLPTVRRWSRDYYAALASARWVFSNDSMPPFFVKRPETTYVQTWHGTPLKRIGFDIEKVQFRNKRYLEEFAREVAKWDRMVSPNPFSTEIMRRAFRYDGEVLETGYPRNDLFYAPDREARAADVRRRLGIAEDKRVVLYAPTWRDDSYDSAGRYRQAIMFDVEAMTAALGEDHVLLFRGHYLTAQTIHSNLGDFMRNVTLWPDIAELYLVADVMITDYSSTMFDYANTRRPMLFFTWDLDKYRDQLRGFYFDFEAEAPGPLLRDGDELIAALKDVDSVHAGFADRYQAFVDRFCPLDDGRAAARVVDAVWG